MTTPNKAAFLDRDGTIIADTGYVGSPDRVRLLPNAARGMARLRDLGYLLVLVTNQSGIARGYFTLDDCRRVQERLDTELAAEGVRLDAVYFCPHLPEGKVSPFNVDCDCRKPKPGLLLRAARDLNIDLAQSVMIGDSERDIEAGKRAGCLTIQVGPAAEVASTKPDFCAKDLLDAAQLLGTRTATPRATP
jgi:D-glycero-D-manno-heptose 1,7-bisphosphate phosphatase